MLDVGSRILEDEDFGQIITTVIDLDFESGRYSFCQAPNDLPDCRSVDGLILHSSYFSAHALLYASFSKMNWCYGHKLWGLVKKTCLSRLDSSRAIAVIEYPALHTVGKNTTCMIHLPHVVCAGAPTSMNRGQYTCRTLRLPLFSVIV